MTPPLRQLDLERLASNKALEGGDARLVVREQLGRGSVFIQRTGLRLFDPDPDQVSRQIVATSESMQGLAGMILGNDLPLELGAMAAMASWHGLSSSESPPPVN